MRLKVVEAFGDLRMVAPAVTGLRHCGRAAGGGFDPWSEARLRGILENTDALVLELAFGRTRIRFDEDVVVAWAGGWGLETEGVFAVDGVKIPALKSIIVPGGKGIEAQVSSLAPRLWIGLGWQPDSIRWGRERLLAGVQVEGTRVPSEVRERFVPAHLSQGDGIRFLPARTAEPFVLTATSQLTRMGLRFSSEFAPHATELASSPVATGTIQLTPSGQVLILGPDGPTIGGYPRLGTVISADHHRLAQVTPGARITFQPVTWEEARSAFERASVALQRDLLLLKITAKG